ncbi:MAG: hypothetical protein HUU21_37675 [Polyangiaceae bacterium]|nr:hypothetical protein [Polyangiaceae bacterium]
MSAEEEEEEKDIAAAESETLSPEDQKKADEMAKALALIESIPDSVIAQGEDAVAQWLKERQPEVSPKGLPGCVAMVGKFLLENFTILKILRIKKTLEALGGAAKFANLTFKLFRKYKKKGLGTKAAIEKAVRVASKRSGKEASALLLQLFGATEVIDACAEV